MRIAFAAVLLSLFSGCACPGEPPPTARPKAAGDPRDETDVPARRDIVTQQRLRDRNATTLDEAARYTPGVTP